MWMDVQRKPGAHTTTNGHRHRQGRCRLFVVPIQLGFPLNDDPTPCWAGLSPVAETNQTNHLFLPKSCCCWFLWVISQHDWRVASLLTLLPQSNQPLVRWPMLASYKEFPATTYPPQKCCCCSPRGVAWANSRPVTTALLMGHCGLHQWRQGTTAHLAPVNGNRRDVTRVVGIPTTWYQLHSGSPSRLVAVKITRVLIGKPASNQHQLVNQLVKSLVLVGLATQPGTARE